MLETLLMMCVLPSVLPATQTHGATNSDTTSVREKYSLSRHLHSNLAKLLTFAFESPLPKHQEQLCVEQVVKTVDQLFTRTAPPSVKNAMWSKREAAPTEALRQIVDSVERQLHTRRFPACKGLPSDQVQDLVHRSISALAMACKEGHTASFPALNSFADDILEILLPQDSSPRRKELLFTAILTTAIMFWLTLGYRLAVVDRCCFRSAPCKCRLCKGYVRMGNLIGTGGFGSVHRASADGQNVVVKLIQVHSISSIQVALDEATHLVKLSHPNVVATKDVFLHKDRDGGEFVAIVMEYCDHGSLFEHVVTGLTWPTLLCALRDVAAGLEAMHKSGVLHCDVKLDNIFVVGTRVRRRGGSAGSRADIDQEETGNSLECHLRFKVGDFGLSTRVRANKRRRLAEQVPFGHSYSYSFAAPFAEPEPQTPKSPAKLPKSPAKSRPKDGETQPLDETPGVRVIRRGRRGLARRRKERARPEVIAAVNSGTIARAVGLVGVGAKRAWASIITPVVSPAVPPVPAAAAAAAVGLPHPHLHPHPHHGLNSGSGSGSGNKRRELRVATLSLSGSQIGGTRCYQAPELFGDNEQQKRVSAACDVWSLGCLLYESATGRDVPLDPPLGEMAWTCTQAQWDEEMMDLKSHFEKCLWQLPDREEDIQSRESRDSRESTEMTKIKDCGDSTSQGDKEKRKQKLNLSPAAEEARRPLAQQLANLFVDMMQREPTKRLTLQTLLTSDVCKYDVLR